MNRSTLALSAILAISPLALAQAGDAHQQHGHGTDAQAQPAAAAQQPQQEAQNAIAVVHALGNRNITGSVRFTKTPTGVRVIADLQGLPANSTHGFHIHEFGDCSAPDGTSAGGHYNPEGHPHAGPDAQQRHAGDLGNIKSDNSGRARLDVTLEGITINGQKNPIVGRSVILHEKADDLKSQPTGDAGGRIACGIIGISRGS